MNYTSLAQQFGTPLYVYDANTIRQRCVELKTAFSGYEKVQWLYAVKANYNPHIVRLIVGQEFGVDAVSLEEVQLALACGVAPEKIMYTETAMTDTEMKTTYDLGVLINIGSVSRFERYAQKFPSTRVCIRINPNVGSGSHATNITGGPDSKFGIAPSDLLAVQQIAQEYSIKIVGIHCHIGSGWLTIEEPLLALDVMTGFAKQFADLEFIDVGGGFGIPYRPNQQPLDLKTLGEKTVEKFRAFCTEYGRELTLRFEPGRFPIAEAGTLVAEVAETKTLGNGREYVGLNTSMSHLMRPALYDSYHEIVNVSRSGGETSTDIGGNVCECADFFAKERHFPKSEIGDIVVIKNAGAYGFAMSSEYQFRPRPIEILVDDEDVRVIRKRDTLESLLKRYE
jgi:diaminopimelate decarboxylase